MRETVMFDCYVAVLGYGIQLRAIMTRVAVPADLVAAEAAIKVAGTCVLNFCASWAEPCTMCNTVFSELSAEHTHLSFVQLDVDAFPELCERFSLESVPAFLFLSTGTLIDSVNGADVPTLVNKVKQHNLSASIAQADVDLTDASAPPSSAAVPLDDRLKALTHRSPVVLFMKGTPDEPRCGFSRTAIELLTTAKITFDTFDILSDEEVRQGLKKYSNWPTYPQLYGDGKLIGGLDIMKELQEDDELAGSLPAAAMQA